MTGDPVDVAIGDYLAEFTLAALSGQRRSGRDGYVGYFVDQLRPNLPVIAERDIKIVANAGGFDPAGLAQRLREVCAEDGVELNIAHTEGDNVLADLATWQEAGEPLTHLDSRQPLSSWGHEPITANAYLGGWGIATALKAGADIVVCGRVTDASLIAGPAAWWHEWATDDWDQLARAVAAGHLIECGAHATGGNFSGFQAIPHMQRPGFPIAEIAEDGTAVMTKHERDGGAVTPDTVTAQLLYELQGVRYLNPDVTVHFDGVTLTPDGKDRVVLGGITGSPPPPTAKVAAFAKVGYTITNTVFATAPDVEAKVELLRAQVEGDGVADDVRLEVAALGVPAVDPQTQWEATVPVRFMAVADDAETLKKFGLARRLGELYLQGIPGFFHDGATPWRTEPSLQIDYWPALVPSEYVAHVVVHSDGRREDAPRPTESSEPSQPVHNEPAQQPIEGETATVELGQLVYARSGDKGGNSNVGVWSRDPAVWTWLRQALSTDEIRRLIPEAKDLDIVRHEMEGIGAVHFVLRGLLGTAGSSNTRVDQIGKAVCEYLRARHIVVPAELAGHDAVRRTAEEIAGLEATSRSD